MIHIKTCLDYRPLITWNQCYLQVLRLVLRVELLPHQREGQKLTTDMMLSLRIENHDL